MSRTFVDVGVVRIGEYVTRVNKLRGIRGASDVISAATRDDQILAMLEETGHRNVTTNPDLGHADGVVHLEVRHPDTGKAAEQAQLVADRVLAHLRRKLPGADLEGSWVQGVDYASAKSAASLAAQSGAVQTGESSRTWLPAVAECPWLNPCTECGRRAARGAGPDATCPDCANRLDAARGSARALRRRLGDFDFPGGEISDLLPKNKVGGPADNHVAMLKADGNSVGALFQVLVANEEITPEQRRKVSLGVGEVTIAAFQEAAQSITDTPAATTTGDTARASTPIIPVLQGGDDLCLFLAADKAWWFTRTLLTAFRARAATMLSDTLGRDQAQTLPALSMSAGLAFTPVKHPAADTFAIAEALMRRAKTLTRGSQASVCWLDVTTNGVAVGEDPAAGRPAARLDDLSLMADPLAGLAAVNQSALKGLARAIADLAGLDLDAELTRRYLRHQAERLGVTAELDPFLKPDSPVPPSDALDLVRWWR